MLGQHLRGVGLLEAVFGLGVAVHQRAGVVDQHVEAVEIRPHLIHQAARHGQPGEVGPDGPHVAGTGIACLLLHPGQSRGVPPDQDQIRA